MGAYAAAQRTVMPPVIQSTRQSENNRRLCLEIARGLGVSTWHLRPRSKHAPRSRRAVGGSFVESAQKGLDQKLSGAVRRLVRRGGGSPRALGFRKGQFRLATRRRSALTCPQISERSFGFSWLSSPRDTNFR